MRAAVIKWQDVVNFLRRCHPATLTALFTEWVRGDVAAPDFSPGMTIATVNVWVALVAAVVALMLSRMYLTVAVG